MTYTYVDFNLPSGNLWCSVNTGAESETDFGIYRSWADHAEKDKYTWETYFINREYCRTDRDPLNNIENISGTEFDMVYKYTSGEQRLPSKEEWMELYDNTVWTWKDDYAGTGINGYEITGKTGSGKMFLPACGDFFESSKAYGQWSADMWSATIVTDDPTHVLFAHACYFSRYSINPDCRNWRCYGFAMRGIKVQK